MAAPDWRKSFYMIGCDEDGVYLDSPQGYKAPREAVEEIAKLLIKTARKHEKDIVIHNLKVERDYEREFMLPQPKKDKSPAKPRYLYMFKCGENRYKIGVSINVERRRKELDNRPYPVTIFAVSREPFSRALEVESCLHKLHANDKIDGEWFVMDDEKAKSTATIVSAANDACEIR